MRTRNKTAIIASMLGILSSVGAVAGEVKIGGTGAAHGLAELLSEAYSLAHPGHTVQVFPGLGSSGGIEAVAAEALHASFSGRKLKPAETARGLREQPYLDSPFLFVSSHPKPQRVSKPEVVAIFGGALKLWPDGKQISPILRPKGDSDTALVVANIDGMGAALERLRQRADVPIAGTDQDNILAAEKTPYSFAGSTLTQIITERPRLKVLPLDGVEPTVEAMEKGEYPLRKRLYLVTQAAPSPDTQRFLRFLTSPEAVKLVRENGGSMVATELAAQ